MNHLSKTNDLCCEKLHIMSGDFCEEIFRLSYILSRSILQVFLACQEFDSCSTVRSDHLHYVDSGIIVSVVWLFL